MNAQSIHYNHRSTALAVQANGLRDASRWVMAIALSLMVYAGLMGFNSLVATLPVPAMSLNALLFSAGFVFLALAVEASEILDMGIHLAVGLGTLLLAWLGINHGFGMTAVAAALPSLRIGAVFIYRHGL